MIRIILTGLSAAVAAGILFVNVYTSVIDAVNWGSALPHSIAVTREYFSATNPGNFFRIVSPVSQILAILAVVACWKYGRVRYIALGALAIAVLSDVLTFGYFYPRNDIMFINPMESNTDAIRLAWEQWTSMNWFRSFMCAVTTCLAFTVMVITTKRSVA